jgi:hypothetical protein
MHRLKDLVRSRTVFAAAGIDRLWDGLSRKRSGGAEALLAEENRWLLLAAM